MSTVYVLEPPTKGKVVLNTTHGPLDIELWPKEAPKAVRNFVQLCLEGYYNHTIFHRIIKGFLLQGGDPTGTGSGTFYFYFTSQLTKPFFLGFQSLIIKISGLIRW
jgi:peptidyl-prolyl cis-trans isomerase SDCCAG10